MILSLLMVLFLVRAIGKAIYNQTLSGVSMSQCILTLTGQSSGLVFMEMI